MEKRYKSIQIRIYPTKHQISQIEQTIGCSRFLHNQMKAERDSVYKKFKDDKEKLYAYKYKTRKEYGEEFPFLKEVSAWAMAYVGLNIKSAYNRFFSKQNRFPKFKSRKTAKANYNVCQVGNNLRIDNNKINLPKLRLVKFRGKVNLEDKKIKRCTVKRTKSGKYMVSILYEYEHVAKPRISDNTIGIDLGISKFITCSNGEYVQTQYKDKLLEFDKKIKLYHRYFSRKQKGSNRREKARIKLARVYEDCSNWQNNYQWQLVNKLCSENQAIGIEDLNVAGMIKNRKLSHKFQLLNMSSFINKLKQKAEDFETKIVQVDRFFPSSKTCSKCGLVKKSLKLSDRLYICDCGLEIDRDLNAGLNLCNAAKLKTESAEAVDYSHRENVRLKELTFDYVGSKFQCDFHRSDDICEVPVYG